MSNFIITTSLASSDIAAKISAGFDDCQIIGVKQFDDEVFKRADALIFIGAMGICVRTVAPFLKSKHTDPAIICVDSTGRFAISVASGHIGNANNLTKHIANLLGAEPIITTQSDLTGCWALDTLGSQNGWTTELRNTSMNRAIFALVNGRPTAFVAECNTEAVRSMKSHIPANVTILDRYEDIPAADFDLIIAVTPRILNPGDKALVMYHPRVLSLGVGCRKMCPTKGVAEAIVSKMRAEGYSPDSICAISSIELKKDEPLIQALASKWSKSRIDIFSADELEAVKVPNPSTRVKDATGAESVAEAAAILSAHGGPLLIEKQKGATKDSAANDFTFAIAADSGSLAGGHIEIVGAGPGNPELVSVRGRRYLEQADLILYAGSLVPKELTLYAHPGCVVRSSADMDLEQQFRLMKEFYDRGQLVVRLHTGDPCIYGAIQEQMAYFDRHNMSYHITPGISSFQAAAAELRSQFTIPEKVQTIILTRGEGRTPMPEREQLHKLAQSQSTMCIYLSAAVVEKVQEELLQAYPPETPVAACYKLTWREQRIYRGQLKDLARIVRDNNLTLTTLLVVGEAIDNRQGLSKLYDASFSHLFRK